MLVVCTRENAERIRWKGDCFGSCREKISKKGNSIIGRIRLVCIPDVTRKTLHDAISLLVAPGATIVTDGWKAYNRLEKLGYEHKIEINGKVEKTPFGEENVILDTSPLPKCHRVISLMKRWILAHYKAL